MAGDGLRFIGFAHGNPMRRAQEDALQPAGTGKLQGEFAQVHQAIVAQSAAATAGAPQMKSPAVAGLFMKQCGFSRST
jgi:hypothetical protein